MSSRYFERFDARSTAVLISTFGAIGLPVFALIAPSLIVAGGFKYLTVIWLFSAITFAITLYVGRLTDRQFAILGFGGMVGVAWAAYLVTDPAVSRAIVALLAAIPAIAAMASSLRVTISFAVFAMGLAVYLSTLNATSWVAVMVAGGASVTTVLVPVFMVGALRRSLDFALSRVAKLGDTDPLTGILNRRGFLNSSSRLLEWIVVHGKCVGFMMIDIDDFKKVNDALGHAAGDAVLVDAVAKIESAAPPFSLISRFGGEEFVVMYASDNREEFFEIAENIRLAVAEKCPVTISVGAVQAPLGKTAAGTPNIDKVIDTLTRMADQSVYYAKNGGRNKVVSMVAPAIQWTPGPPSEPTVRIVDTTRNVGVLALMRRVTDKDQAAPARDGENRL
ncbi:GGDEF domain-containing protein [Williamsia soli]|uniref:GGDEF domain-containing protein n=1 Tax=Williamsia soli TaxID=364929 RepID=UPI001A9E90FB|nr:GGDEF domain-containing protein [Williamsia soli]